MNATTKTTRVDPLPPEQLQAREVARLAEYARACALNKTDGAQPTSQELKSLDKARAELERAKNAGNRDIALEKVEKIERGIRNRADSAWRSATNAETINLAEGRGETVEASKGAIRISSRDGLRSLREAGHITEDQYAVGMEYRAGHEARGRDLKAQNIGDGAGGGHNNDLFVASRVLRARKLEFTARVDRAVACACISRPSALQMLRAVAGEGGSLSAWGEGRALARNREALIEALDIAKKVAREMKP